jgi:hypothetical protein
MRKTDDFEYRSLHIIFIRVQKYGKYYDFDLKIYIELNELKKLYAG